MQILKVDFLLANVFFFFKANDFLFCFNIRASLLRRSISSVFEARCSGRRGDGADLRGRGAVVGVLGGAARGLEEGLGMSRSPPKKHAKHAKDVGFGWFWMVFEN